MTTVTVDDALRARLNGLGAEVELRSESGQPLGYFVPAELYLLFLYARARKQLSDDEIEQLRRQSGGRPLADILKDLGAA
jgi:hypothetical protein